MERIPPLLKRLTALAVFAFLVLSAAASDPMDLGENVRQAFSRAGLPLAREKRPVIDFSLKLAGGGADGRTATLGDLKGKVVFLNFWATWCPPCRAEMPSMEILYRRFHGQGLELLAVDLMENSKTVSAFLSDNNLSFPAALDSNGRVGSNYGIQAIPATFIIDRDGKIILYTAGGRNWNTPAIIAAFEELLKHGN
ncbi:MAG: TlpA family protein disulfide reductase [Spirochaetaceae bacterium]|jgi:thiol-disulfide isomerase/thioredoxin|nr:TlpA family protein disulfide reductase [Spirochaetaceae bacterium]